tara:strand:- start:350 stop:535 length:186 start_codon:yes stop_codon:yes gene_type:complete
MTRLIEAQNNPDKVIEAVEAMIDTWTLEELMDFVIEDRAEYYLGKNVSKDEVEELINEYGE